MTVTSTMVCPDAAFRPRSASGRGQLATSTTLSISCRCHVRTANAVITRGTGVSSRTIKLALTTDVPRCLSLSVTYRYKVEEENSNDGTDLLVSDASGERGDAVRGRHDPRASARAASPRRRMRRPQYPRDAVDAAGLPVSAGRLPLRRDAVDRRFASDSPGLAGGLPGSPSTHRCHPCFFRPNAIIVEPSARSRRNRRGVAAKISEIQPRAGWSPTDSRASGRGISGSSY